MVPGLFYYPVLTKGNNWHYVGFDVLTAIDMKSSIFWNIT
jgi:hypothetical protein